MQDYPAAHSMDTEWFAVDASGNLAIFDSGEGGAVPQSYYNVRQSARYGGFDNFLFEMSKNNKSRLIRLNIPIDVVVESFFFNEQHDQDVSLVSSDVVATILSLNELDGQDVLFDRKSIGSEEEAQIYLEKSLTLPLKKPIDTYVDGWLLWLASDDVIAQLGLEESEYNYAVGFSGESTIVFVRECNFHILQDLFEKGQILAGKAFNDYHNGLARLCGCFVYEQDSNIPLPYTCIGKPIAPLRMEDLPEYLQDAVSWNWFESLQFNETQTIQPIEHMPCKTWGGSGG